MALPVSLATPIFPDASALSEPQTIRTVCTAIAPWVGRASRATKNLKLAPTKMATNATTEANAFPDSKTSIKTNNSFATALRPAGSLENTAKRTLNELAPTALATAMMVFASMEANAIPTFPNFLLDNVFVTTHTADIIVNTTQKKYRNVISIAKMVVNVSLGSFLKPMNTWFVSVLPVLVEPCAKHLPKCVATRAITCALMGGRVSQPACKRPAAKFDRNTTAIAQRLRMTTTTFSLASSVNILRPPFVATTILICFAHREESAK
mmetsp:Transcript_22347/g.47120  ORF Transcript_22347/g.47120 Transcript_22347/m.47120 type:complete len:266 (-) Transcript_22347:2147-2944(-)